MTMEKNYEDALETIKKYRFAILPPRVYRQGDDSERTKESEEGRYSVQCQLCGRMGAMTLDDMRKHAEMHSAQQKEKQEE